MKARIVLDLAAVLSQSLAHAPDISNAEKRILHWRLFIPQDRFRALSCLI
jgi:hypothetical protein